MFRAGSLLPSSLLALLGLACSSALDRVAVPEAAVRSGATMIAGTARDDVWLVGRGEKPGTLGAHHWDGSAFSRVSVPTSNAQVAQTRGTLLAIGPYPQLRRIHADGAVASVPGFEALPGAAFGAAAVSRGGVVYFGEDYRDGSNGLLRLQDGRFDRLPAPPLVPEDEVQQVRLVPVAVMPGGGLFATMYVTSGPRGHAAYSTWTVTWDGHAWQPPERHSQFPSLAFVVGDALYLGDFGGSVSALTGYESRVATVPGHYAKVTPASTELVSFEPPSDLVEHAGGFLGVGVIPDREGGFGVVGWDHDARPGREACDFVYLPIRQGRLTSAVELIDDGDCGWFATGHPPLGTPAILEDGTSAWVSYEGGQGELVVGVP